MAGATSPSVSLEVISTVRGTVVAASGGGGGGGGGDGGAGAGAATNSNESKTCLTGAGNNGVEAKLTEGLVVSAVVVVAVSYVLCIRSKLIIE